MYTDGNNGITQDLTKATEMYRKACDGDLESECYSLGVAYAQGQGVQQSNDEALKLFRKSCELTYLIGCESQTRLEADMGMNSASK